MIFFALFLLLLGILFFSIEIFVPGFGVFGMFSFLSILSSFFVIFIYVPYGFFIVAAQLIILIAASLVLFHVLKKRKLLKKIVLTENLKSDSQTDFASYINKIGITTTMLKPSGFVRFDDDTIEVYSQFGLIEPNTKVKVTEVRNKKVFVARV